MSDKLRWGGLAAVVIVGGVVGFARCAPAREAVEGVVLVPSMPSASAEASCGTRFGKSLPNLETLAPVKDPPSVMRLAVRVSTEQLGREIDKNVPRALGSAKRQPIGSAGEVTYDVSRGPFAFALRDDRLVLSTPVTARVSVCKPLGPLCPTYGRCSPRLTTTAKVPLMVDTSYALAKPKVSYTIDAGCSIVGVNVTSKIRELADSRMVAVRQQIAKAMPDVASLAQKGHERMSEPLPFEGGCAQIRVDGIEQARPRLEAGNLLLRAVARGHVSVSATCGETTKLPMPSIVDLEANAVIPPVSELRVGFDVSDDELTAGLRSIVGKEISPGTRVTNVGWRSGRLEGKPTFVVSLTVEGRSCGVVHVLTDLVADLKTRTIALTHLQPGEPLEGLDALEQIRVPLPALATSTIRAMDGWTLDLAAAGFDEVPVELKVDRSVPTAQVVPQPGGGARLVVTQSVRLEARL